MNVTPAYYLCSRSTGFCTCRVEFYHVYGMPCLRETKIIIRYTRFLAKFLPGFEYVALFHMLFVKFMIIIIISLFAHIETCLYQ